MSERAPDEKTVEVAAHQRKLPPRRAPEPKEKNTYTIKNRTVTRLKLGERPK